MSDPALGNLDAMLPDLAELYKDVHSHPELSMQETRTAAFVNRPFNCGLLSSYHSSSLQ
jgi:metal-dependent amidase/aminoacylase/carboxypeptidase family protein